MMLEEHVILVRKTTNSSENITAHEVVHVGAEAVDDLCSLAGRFMNPTRQTHVMIVPDVDLGNLSIDRRKRRRVIPADVILQVVIVTFSTQRLRKRIISALLGIANVGPGTQRTADTDTFVYQQQFRLLSSFGNPTIVVDLVTSSDHDVEWDGSMFPYNIVP